ncbi:MAG TPA: hypothetical protein DEB46_11640 [Myxococcales bacterium]|nr:hypothetical protein [Myxococcales bacterium]
MRFILIPTLLLSSPAIADDNPAKITEPKGAFPLSGSVRWGHTLGQGSFVQNYYARNALYSQSLSFSGTLRLPMGFSVTASQGLSKELTTGGATRNHETTYGDIGLSFGLPWRTKVAGFDLGMGLGASLPVSMASRFSNKITGLSLSGSASKGGMLDGKLNFSWGIGLSRGIYAEFQRTRDITSGNTFVDGEGNEITPMLCIPRSEEQVLDASGELAGCVVPGVNGGVNLSNSLSLSYKLSKKSRLSVGLSLINSFKTYAMPQDEFTAENAVSGYGRMDMTGGSLGYSYSYSDKLSLSLRAGSTQPALYYSVEGEGMESTGSWRPNFPFWDFRTPGNNYSSFSGSISYRL